jgi:hypothetical protein
MAARSHLYRAESRSNRKFTAYRPFKSRTQASGYYKFSSGAKIAVLSSRVGEDIRDLLALFDEV